MNTLALSDEILLTIDKPARYIGNELNMVKKNPKDVDIRFAMCFPDVYESECLTWAFRFYMICLISGMMYTANGFILRGRIYTRL